MHIKQRYWFIAAILFVLLSIGVGGWVWSEVLSLQHSMQHSTQQSSLQQAPRLHVTPDVDAGLDVTSGGRLLIPAIGVNAPIETVGKTSEGLMDVPIHNQWTGVGWYKNGPEPGQMGSAVIDGHLDRTGGAPAVFWDLHKLQPGDIVSVQNATKHTLHFKVLKVANYAPDVAPLVQIFGQKNGTFLNLVTCAGVWVQAENQTSQRLVVYTKLVV
jgi:LPXTG-site transpeptidase (sortase) family protein